MPWPTKDESKEHYISRAIPEIMADKDKDSKQAAGQAYGMWDEKKPTMKRKQEQFATMARFKPRTSPKSILMSLYRNPSLEEMRKYIAYGARGYITENGDLYLEGYETGEGGSRNTTKVIHDVILQVLQDYDPKLVPGSIIDAAWESVEHGVPVQRVDNTPKICLSESMGPGIVLKSRDHIYTILDRAQALNPHLEISPERVDDIQKERIGNLSGARRLVQEGVDLNRAYDFKPGHYDSPDFHQFDFTTDSGTSYKIVLSIDDIYYRDDSPKFMEILFGDMDDEGAPNYKRREVGIKEMYRILATVVKAVFECLNENPLILALVFDADKGEDTEHNDSRQRSYRTMASQLAKYLEWNYAVSSKSATNEKYYVVCPKLPEEMIEEMLRHEVFSSMNKPVDKDLVAKLRGMKEGISKKYYFKDGGPTRYQNTPNSFDDVNSHRAGMALDKGFDLNKREVCYSGPVVGDRIHTIHESMEDEHLGDILEWDTLRGEKHKGPVVEFDGNIVFVDCEICGQVVAIEDGGDMLQESTDNEEIAKFILMPSQAVEDGKFYWQDPTTDEIHGGEIINLDPPDFVITVDCEFCHDECFTADFRDALDQEWWDKANKFLKKNHPEIFEEDIDLFESRIREKGLCPVCHGTGKKTKINGDKVECSYCDGIGKVEALNEVTEPKSEIFDVDSIYNKKDHPRYTLIGRGITSAGEEVSFYTREADTMDCRTGKNLNRGKISQTSISTVGQGDSGELLQRWGRSFPPEWENLLGTILEKQKVEELNEGKDYERLLQKMKQQKDPKGLTEFFRSIEEDMGGGVGLSGDFQAHAPEHMIGMNGVANITNKGTGNTKHGKMDDRTWDSAYTRTRSEDYLRVKENIEVFVEEVLEEERAVQAVAFRFPDNLKGVSDIHSTSQIQGVLNAFGRGVVLSNGEVRIGAIGSSHVGLLQGDQEGRRFYWGYRSGVPVGTVYIVSKNGMDDSVFRKPQILKMILSQVFNLLKLSVAPGGLKFVESYYSMREKKNEFEKLQKNKVPLTDEERAECMKQKAVWHFYIGKDGKHKDTPAVWKSKNPKTGKIAYVTNTHRAYNTAPTLKGAIGRFHSFIRSTA